MEGLKSSFSSQLSPIDKVKLSFLSTVPPGEIISDLWFLLRSKDELTVWLEDESP
uniref:Uncharacterized protein n=1 Tax=Tetranychus urticae TaxID=32264 RepID=T1KLU3_TETUR